MDAEKAVGVKKPAVRRMKADEFSNPYLNQEIRINSSPAQAVFADGFDRCDAALRSLSVVLPAVLRNEHEIAAVNGAVEHLLNNALSDLHTEQSRVQKIAEDNGLEIGKVNYTNVVAYQAKITCNKSGQYLQLIRDLDKLIESIHSTWLVGFINDEARAALERQWRRKILSVVAEIEAIAKRAFAAAQKLKLDTGKLKDGAEPIGDSEEAPTRKPRKSKKTEQAEQAEHGEECKNTIHETAPMD